MVASIGSFKLPRAETGLKSVYSLICRDGEGGWGKQADITLPARAPVPEEIRALMLAQVVSFPSEHLRVASRQPGTGRLGVSAKSY